MGEWDIRQRILQADGSWREFPAATSVTRALSGRALIEHWQGEVLFYWAGMREPVSITGLSVRAYDPASGKWSIYWMDSLSPQFGEPYVGTIQGGHGVFVREWDTPQGRRSGRITFATPGPDVVEWSLAISPDGGETWSVIWAMSMERRAIDVAG